MLLKYKIIVIKKQLFAARKKVEALVIARILKLKNIASAHNKSINTPIIAEILAIQSKNGPNGFMIFSVCE